MALAYAWEMLYVGTTNLAAGEGTLRARLECAWLSSLSSLVSDDFPTRELRDLFEFLQSEIAPPGAQVHDVLASWSDGDVVRLAELVVSLHDSTARRYQLT
jgi:hypothetical protein